MKARTCIVRVSISNDKAEVCEYTVRPVPAADLGPAAAAFLLTNHSKQPSPLYLVELAEAGHVMCDCPQFGFAGNCKHADALAAAGLLPCALVGLLQQRTRLLDEAEADAKRHERNTANLTASVANLNERNAHLSRLLDEAQALLAETEEKLAAVSARAVQLQTGLAAAQSGRPRRRSSAA